MDSVALRAKKCLEYAWSHAERHQCIVWLDNFFKRRYGVNPTRPDLTCDSCAIAVLHTRFVGQSNFTASLKDMITRTTTMAYDIFGHQEFVSKALETLDDGVMAEEIRVPLDVVREGGGAR